MLYRKMIQLWWKLVILALSHSAFAGEKVVVIPMPGDTAYRVKSGQTLTGALSASGGIGDRYPAMAISYASPFPVGTPVPTFVYGVSAQCTGVGTASPGVLCVYPNFQNNVLTVLGWINNNPNHLHGFGLYYEADDLDARSYFQGTWAYQVP